MAEPQMAESAFGPGGNRRFEDELLLLLARQSKRVPIATFLAASIIAAFASDYLPITAWGTWLIAVGLVLLMRLMILPRLVDMHHMSYEARIRIAISLSILNGVVHGSSLIFFPFLPELERAIHSVILAALCTGAVATTAGYLPVFLGYLIPTFFGMVPLWMLNPGLQDVTWRQYSLAALLFIFGFILIGLARDAYQVLRDSYDIREKERELNRKMSRALADAEAANNAKTRFLASASHDLRQPIHTLTLFSAALSMRDLDDKTRDIANHINVSLESLASQLDALLDVSKLDAGIVEKKISSFDLRQVMQNLEQEFAPLCEEKGLVFKCRTHDSLPQLETDPVLFERVLRNLLSNAIKYTDEGSIRLFTNEHEGKHYLRVADTGRGVPEEEQKKIFEEFYQVDNPERDRSKGLGLGLAIVKRLTKILDIPMTMHSIAGKGSNFQLELPTGTETKAEEPIMINHAIKDAHPNHHILVVDDEVEVRAGMETLLDSMGFSVAVADSTEKVLELAREKKPQLVLADLRLRGEESGIAAIHAIRELIPGIPALLISGDTAPNRLRGAKLAGIEMLHKPVPLNVLQRSIANACGIEQQ